MTTTTQAQPGIDLNKLTRYAPTDRSRNYADVKALAQARAAQPAAADYQQHEQHCGEPCPICPNGKLIPLHMHLCDKCGAEVGTDADATANVKAFERAQAAPAVRADVPSIDTPELRAWADEWAAKLHGKTAGDHSPAWDALIAHITSTIVTHPAPASEQPDRGEAQGDELPPLPHTTYNGYSDGSEPLYTTDQMHDYGLACIAIGRGAAVRDYVQLLAVPHDHQARAVPDGLYEQFKRAFLSWNGFHTEKELTQSWGPGMLAGEMFRAGAATQPVAPAAPVVRVEVPDGFVWPEPPPSKGQSHVLFDDGYAEGWAKAIDTVRNLLAASPSPSEPHGQEATTGIDFTLTIETEIARRLAERGIDYSAYRARVQQEAARPVARVTKMPGCFDLESLIHDDEWPDGLTDLYAAPVAGEAAQPVDDARDSELLDWLGQNFFSDQKDEWDERLTPSSIKWKFFAPMVVQGDIRLVLRAAQQAQQAQPTANEAGSAGAVEASPAPAQGAMVGEQSKVEIMREGSRFWHTNCEKNHFCNGIMKEVCREPERSLIECQHCGKAGYYPVGGVGQVCADEVSSEAQNSAKDGGGHV